MSRTSILTVYSKSVYLSAIWIVSTCYHNRVPAHFFSLHLVDDSFSDELQVQRDRA